MSFEYDPYSDEAMGDPRSLYDDLRVHDPVFYLAKYDTWILTSFEAVWQVCTNTAAFSCTTGMAPNQILLGEHVSPTFSALDPPEHRMRRKVIAPSYARGMAELDVDIARAFARRFLKEMAARDEAVDLRQDYAFRVMARLAAHKAGIPESEAEWIRHLVSKTLARERGQRGTSDANRTAGQEAREYLLELVVAARADPDSARGHLAELTQGEMNGRPLSDAEVIADLMTILITGSDTTEFGVVGTLYNLARNPDQLRTVEQDPNLIPHAFSESLRYDHPTNMLGRIVRQEVKILDKLLQPGQGVLLVWAAANRDETEFPNALVYDIGRRYKRSLLFGHGEHKCIGEHLALQVGTALLDEFFKATCGYEIDFAGCERLYGEALKGFTKVPASVRFGVSPSEKEIQR